MKMIPKKRTAANSKISMDDTSIFIFALRGLSASCGKALLFLYALFSSNFVATPYYGAPGETEEPGL